MATEEKTAERKDKKKQGFMMVDCEICGEHHSLTSDYAGFYVCGKCRRDIVSHHNHD